MMTKLLSILPFLPLLNCQLAFPDENGGLSQFISETATVSQENLTEIRGTNLYEKYVDEIISQGILKLTLGINKAITSASKKSNDNIVYAPVSIAAALALVLLGSNGKTFDEIAALMGFTTGVDIKNKSQEVHEQFGRVIQKLQEKSGFNIGEQIDFATAVFVQQDFPIRTVYRETAEAIYESEVLNLDFKTNKQKAQQVINAWVSERTHGKITSLLAGPPEHTTKVILASAMYFRAEWAISFYDELTKRLPFYTNGRHMPSDVMVDMMVNGGKFPYFKDSALNCEVLGFPYKGKKTVMYVVKPENSTKERLKELEARLTAADVERLVSSVEYRRAAVLFPKMKIESTIELVDVLELLGIKALFNPHEANLSLISPGTSTASSSASSSAAAAAAPLAQQAAVNPISARAPDDDDAVLIFSRLGTPVDCTQIFNPNSTVNTCQEIVADTPNGTQRVTYKKFGDKVGRRVTRKIGPIETLDTVRQHLNQPGNGNDFENPHLFANQVTHKVYMDITERGTEAAASTSISLARGGNIVNFRVDVPFLFFIRHEESKTILFWGSVLTPTPSFN